MRILCAFLAVQAVAAIGENAMDLQTITGIISGLGSMVGQTVETINLPAELFMGKWHQMYKAAINFDVFRTQMFCQVSYFKENSVMGSDGFSIEEAYRVVSKNGPIETYKRDMNKVGPGQYWMYTEEYFYPRQFYILHAGPGYDNETMGTEAPEGIQYLVVSDSNRLSLMVMARDPNTYYQKYDEEVKTYLKTKGFGGNVFWNSPKPIYQGQDCEWPTEKEVFARRVLKNQEALEKSKQNAVTEKSAIGDSPLADFFKNPTKILQELAKQAAMHLALVLLGLFAAVQAQLEPFGPDRFDPKPTVPPEFRQYFELDGHARELVDSLLGPRPGGFFPEKTYEIGQGTPVAAQGGAAQPRHEISKLERTLEQFFTAPEGEAANGLPPGFGSGFSVLNNHKQIAGTGLQRDGKQQHINTDGNSIAGIPNVFPKLPKAPMMNQPTVAPSRKPLIADDLPVMPSIEAAPEVPEGGMLPSDVRRAPESVGDVPLDDSEPGDGEYGGLAEETSTGGGGLIGTILNLINLGSKKVKEGGKPGSGNATAIGSAVSNLLSGPNSPLPGSDLKNFFSNSLYKALTAGSVQKNETDAPGNGTELTDAQKAAIGENLEMIQNLIIQPSSPLCTSKPEPVDFDFYALLGQWYQVVYSPPLSRGPCSMVVYKKLSENNNGGAGSIFETFEYATDGTPNARPSIMSGYAIVKSAGELIFRTSSNKEDVNIHVLHTGPLNANNEYEFVVMSTNCNFPMYVFARDPVVYKQRYETAVMEMMEKKGWVNGFSRLLNVVASVDQSMCSFPPSLFNYQG
ncbi:unnamed protein product, partial [Mesorhabditis spiculigera]